MPCKYDVDPREERAALDRLKHELDETTRMLCALCQLCDDVKLPYMISGLREWWSKHKETDVKRRARLREQALSKLADDELEALGIER